MEILNRKFNFEIFLGRLRDTEKRALMLDYDGTLAPFRVEREKAVPYPGVREILSRLITAGRTRVIIISGRPVKNLLPLIGLDVSPEVWGSHGLEHLTTNNEYEVAELKPITQQGLSEARRWIDEEGLTRISEKKPSGIAFHWRSMNNEEVESLKEKIQKKWFSAARNFGLILSEFDGGLELRAVGITKGNAVENIIREMGAGVMLAYLGDDVTDEDAFKTLCGRGLSVLVRERLRETAADLWIKPPGELLEFLKTWIEWGG